MSANDKHTKAEITDGSGDPAIDLAREPDFHLGELLVRPSSREVVLDDRTEMLEPRVLQVLIVLARRRGEVVSREQLVESCWGGRVVSEDAINRSITKVRRWSKPATFTLETIPRVGYRLEAAAKPASAAAATPAQSVTVATPRRYSLRKKILIAVATVFTLFLAMGIWFGIGAWRDANRPYFAVLQFDALSTDADAVALAEAVSTAINHRLTELGFRVVSPALSSQYRGTRKAEAAEALAPRYVIDGSVRKDGTRLRVAARVDATSKPVTVWSREFDVNLNEAQALPERIGTVLAGLFNPTLQSGPRRPPEVIAGELRISELRMAGNDMDAYLAAKELMREVPIHYTPRVWYALTTADALDMIPVVERTTALNDARQAAERADKAVLGTLSAVHSAVTPTVEWSTREKLLRAGLEETYADASGIRYALSSLLVSSGRIYEAVDIAKQAVTVDPLSARNVASHASMLDVAGRRKQADDLLDHAEALWPKLELIERLRFGSALARSDLRAASTLLQDPVIGLLLDPPAEHRPFVALLRALATQKPADVAEVERDCADPSKLARDRAALCLQGLIALDRLDTFFQVSPAYFPEQRGATAAERDAHWLQAPRVGRYTRVLFRSDTKAVRADPRFIPIVERLGLLDYWRSSGKWPDFCETEPESVCSRMQKE
jgi:DNA-binding winged helix-turn-helix (wHTH) protein/TolB-like protein